MRRVVVTGLGVVSSIGIGKDEFWENLIKGKSGISKITSFDTSDYPSQYGGEIRNLQLEKFIDRRKISLLGKASLLSIAAAKLALRDAYLDIIEGTEGENVAIFIGTTMGETQLMEEIDSTWVKKGQESVKFASISQYPSSNISANLGREIRVKGDNFVMPTACAAGNYSIGYGFDNIKCGKVDVALAGGADAFSKVAYAGFNRLYAMSPDKCQPFDKNRKGMLVGEGAAILVLESLEHALKRKAHIYAEIIGYGLSCDAYHMTHPTESGIAKCMQKAMEESKINIDDVDYISAHGTGTPQNDKTEVSAIKKVFGKRHKKIPVSSIKSMLGHTMGAAAAIEAVACCLAIENEVLPPTINYETPDSECDIDCVPNKARKNKIKIAFNNSYAFGGNDACLVLKKYNV